MNGFYDIHCHILPGVDDGAKDMKEAWRMLEREYLQGVRKIILTPHFRYEMFQPSLKTIEHQFKILQTAAAEISPELQLYLGCELHVSMDMVDKLNKGERLTMAGSRYVLTEFGSFDEQTYIRERIQQLLLNGYIPVLAHVERCRALREDLGFIEEMKALRACMQVNTDSITGREGFKVKKFCKMLMKQDLLDFVGTDGHDMKKRVPEIAKCYAQVEKMMGTQYANRIFMKNPEKIIK